MRQICKVTASFKKECEWKSNQKEFFRKDVKEVRLLWRGRYPGSDSSKQITSLPLAHWLPPLLPPRTPATAFSSGAQGRASTNTKGTDLGLCFCRAGRMGLAAVAALNCLFPPAESRLVFATGASRRSQKYPETSQESMSNTNSP